MKKIVFICPYFGKFPYDQMRLWLKTCSYNKNINWLILTDDQTEYVHYDNVKFVYTTFSDLKAKIQSKFDFEISLENAYKLCDFKPTYGYVFQDLIEEYDYWGHCDPTDSIYGDLEKMLNIEQLSKFDKIGFLGHMTIYRNKKEVNERFFIKSNAGKDLKDILGTNKNMGFDEIFDYSINSIYLDNDYPVARIDEIYADATPLYHNFKTSIWSDNFSYVGRNKEKYIFEWDNGKLYKIFLSNNEIVKNEIGYFHYQKRKMKYDINIEECTHFFVVPNKFINQKKLDKKFVKKYTCFTLKNYIRFLKIKYKRFKIKLANLSKK